jgi:hypothetical protein
VFSESEIRFALWLLFLGGVWLGGVIVALIWLAVR